MRTGRIDIVLAWTWKQARQFSLVPSAYSQENHRGAAELLQRCRSENQGFWLFSFFLSVFTEGRP